MRPGDAIKTVQRFFNAYLTRRDVSETLFCLAEEILWTGIEQAAWVRGRAQVETLLLAEIAQAPEAYRITYDKMEESAVQHGCAVVQLAATVYPEKEGAGAIGVRGSAVCVEEQDGVCRIASIHTSIPHGQPDDGPRYPAAGGNRWEMEPRLERKALDIIRKSIPGGMMGGYLEPDFPLYYIDDRLLSHLGYTYEEFVKATGGKIINGIDPDDRNRLNAQVEAAMQIGETYEMQYRLLKKDGSKIWVNDVGKRGLCEDGRSIFVSVIRDITEEMETRERLERQAKRYDHLFQSVVCGIVQYKVIGPQVVFKNANQEAIHLFGYTPEEFWAKEEWDLASLIAEEDRTRVLAEISRLKKPGDRNPFEYQMLQQDGSRRWIIGSAEVIIDTEGEQLVQSVYLDITKRKKAELRSERLEEQVEASNELLHMALEHTSTYEFFYYPQSRVCVVPERTCANFHCQNRYEGMPDSFAAEQVDEAFRPAFYEMYANIHRGERTSSGEFLRKDSHIWFRETLSLVRSQEDGSPQFVIGIVEDITHQKEIEEALAQARSRDSLTGLHHKEGGIQQVKDYLAGKVSGEHGVMMLLDMDDFEEINQQEGKIFADAILQEVADILRGEAGANSIAARLGGDEFMLFLKNSCEAQAALIGSRIVSQVQGMMMNTERNIHVSVSIGMCSTEAVSGYNNLYRCAESTLKYVKEHGKGQAASYRDASRKAGIFLTQLYPETHPVNAIEMETPLTDGNLLSFALDLLGKAKNVDDAVSLILMRIGKTYQFDRVSIIEANRAYLTYRFSYQWARDRADIQLGQDFYVSEEDFEICAAMYDEDGLASQNVREGISHIASCLHAGIWEYGEYVGSMSFEVDQPNYQWSKEQRKLLKELVKIVPSFIMKSKADAVSQAKTDFLSRMSHEIRTPMNAISGMTTIAKSVLDNKQKTLECLQKIETANIYLLNLVNDILDMSRIESGKMELNNRPLDLAELLASLASMFYAQASEKGLTLDMEDGRNQRRPLMADGLRLNQVFVNIIGNAIKFTNQGGVTVRVEELAAEPKAALRFSVADTGIGIAPSALSRIFNPFEQAEASTAARQGGTGLGLSISSRLVQMMGGTLEVQSQLGAGSTFYFTLTFDYAPEETPKTIPQAEEETPPDFHGRNILLAEDNEINREIAQTLLEMHGFTVTCAVNGEEALDRFCAEEPGSFDGILMDIRMPVMDGLESTRRIRTSGRPDARTIPIIALSANAFDEDSKKSIASGMDGHLSKPIQVDQLLKLLHQCIHQTEREGGQTPVVPR